MQKLRERLTRDLSMALPQPPAHGDSSLTHCHCPQPIQPPKDNFPGKCSSSERPWEPHSLTKSPYGPGFSADVHEQMGIVSNN